jgi:oryzin
MLPLLLVLLTTLALASPIRSNSTAHRGKYIVTLKPGVMASQVSSHVSWARGVHARSVHRRSEQGVDKVWTGHFKGYSGEFDDATAAEIAQHGEVSRFLPFRSHAKNRPDDFDAGRSSRTSADD